MKFDPTKPVQTRDGRKARIICTDAKGGNPIVALRTSENGKYEVMELYYEDGRCQASSPGCDLINIPEKRTLDCWVNVYDRKCAPVCEYSSRSYADASAGPDRIACLHIVQEYTVGEGLE
jgi:hypothetical protein